jgi:hypothetical protein
MDNRFWLNLVALRHQTGKRALSISATAAVFAICFTAAIPSLASPVHGWLSWRGPEQTGVSRETSLPDKVSAQDALWVADFPGASAPVIANGKLYAMGYLCQGADLQEGVACFDA